MKTKIFILAISFLMVMGVNAQEYSNGEMTVKSNSLNHKLQGRQFIFAYVPEGSEFINDNWDKGYVILDNNDRYDSLSMKYNSLHDELIYVNERTKKMVELDKNSVSEFGFYKNLDDVMRFKRFFYNKNIYFNVLYDGNMKLLVRYITSNEKTSTYKDKFGHVQDSKYVLRTEYYMMFPDGDLERFRTTKNSFIQLFPDKKKDLKKLCRKNHIDFKKDNDLISFTKQIENKYFTSVE
jgi:hypothetical protein